MSNYSSTSFVLLEKLLNNPVSVLIPLSFFTIFLYKWLSAYRSSSQQLLLVLPPSPPKLPIIGNLHQLGKFPHRSVASLSEKYGKLMLLHLGSKPTLVVSSADGAREIMATNDVIFANRPSMRFFKRIFYDGNEIICGQYGEYWRQLKSIVVMQVLSSKKVQSYRRVREEEVALVIDKIKKSASFGQYNSNNNNNIPVEVNLSATIFGLSRDLLCRTALGRKYIGNEGGTDFEELFKEITATLRMICVGDFIPWLCWIDRVTGLEDRVEKHRKKFDHFINKVIQEHIDDSASAAKTSSINNEEDIGVGNGDNVKDFVDVLLQIRREDPGRLSTDSISGLILDTFIGATETIYTVLEWAISEVLRHPRVMKELQDEVRGIVKSNKGEITEDDLGKMKYLKAVIKETLRLHPPAPLMLPRESSQDVKINGYNIAIGTQVIINVWAIQRDPTYWEEPGEFRPERFLNSSVDFRGQHFHFIPFGAGRRGCPGILLASATMELVLASLVYEFNWKLPDGAASETVDMTETAGITIHRLHPLKVIATPNSCK